MTTAKFRYETRAKKFIFGSVTLKNDGKVSISLLGADNYNSCAADRYSAKRLANQIAEAKFDHPAAFDVKTDKDRTGLIAKLTTETQDLKERYIQSVKDWAENKYKDALARKGWNEAQYREKYGTEKKVAKYQQNYLGGKTILKGEEYDVLSTYGKTVWVETKNLLVIPMDKYIAKEEKYANIHYTNSIERLAERLHNKGVTDTTEIEITKAWVEVNLEMTILHDGITTKAWTIVAEGAIQRPHYRYLVK